MNEWSENWKCKSGYREFMVGIYGKCIESPVPVLIQVDVCVDDFKYTKDPDVNNEANLQDVITEKPNSIYDMYVDSDLSEAMQKCGIPLHKMHNRGFRRLDRASTIEQFKKGIVDIVEILPP